MPVLPRLRGVAFMAAVASAFALAGCAGEPVGDTVRTTTGEPAMPFTGSGQIAALLRLGKATMDSGDYDSAVGFYRRAHQIDGRNFEALLGLGRSLSRVGANDEAAAALREALDRKPGDLEALRELGNVLIALGRPSLAISEFEAVLQKKHDSRTFNGMGVALDMLGDQGAAQAHYRAGLEIDPSNVSIRNNLALSLAVSGKYAEAVRLLESVTGGVGATPRERQNLALVYGLAGEWEKSARVARLDLDEQAVRRNLAFYQTLKALGDPRKVAEAVGLRRRGPDGTGSQSPYAAPIPPAQPVSPLMQ
jgi:Flp pilus assembly protein TadD